MRPIGSSLPSILREQKLENEAIAFLIKALLKLVEKKQAFFVRA